MCIHADGRHRDRAGESVVDIAQVDLAGAGDGRNRVLRALLHQERGPGEFERRGLAYAGGDRFTGVGIDALRRDLEGTADAVGLVQSNGGAIVDDADALAPGIADDGYAGSNIAGEDRCVGGSHTVIRRGEQIAVAVHAQGNDAVEADFVVRRGRRAATDQVVRRITLHELAGAGEVEATADLQGSIFRAAVVDVRLLGDGTAAVEREIAGDQAVVEHRTRRRGVLDGDVVGVVGRAIEGQAAVEQDRRTGRLGQRASHFDGNVGRAGAVGNTDDLQRGAVDGADFQAIGIDKDQRGIA